MIYVLWLVVGDGHFVDYETPVSVWMTREEAEAERKERNACMFITEQEPGPLRSTA